MNEQNQQVKGVTLRCCRAGRSWTCPARYQDYLAEQFDEVLRKFALVDGIFLGHVLGPGQPVPVGDRRHEEAGWTRRARTTASATLRQVAHEYMGRFRQMLDEAQKGHEPAGIWFNSRPKTNLAEERRFLRHIEVECLPDRRLGLHVFPSAARFVRPLGLPTLSHTGRFHRSWGDFGGLKPEAALRYECCSILSQGLTNGIGDQLHPRGALDGATYQLIGKVYGHVKACEPYVVGGTLLSQIAVVIDPSRGDRASQDVLGLIRALQQLRHQFDFVAPGDDLGAYELVIVPDSLPIGGALRDSLRAYLRAGGALLVGGGAALNEVGEPALPEMGIQAQGASPFTATYLRPEGVLADGIAPLDHVMYERGFRMTPGDGAQVLCRIVDPYFERSYDHFCSHAQTPADKLSPHAAIVQNGRVITSAVPIFTAYGKYGNVPYRQILGRCIDRLLPRPLIRDGGPSHLEATVVRKGATTVVHLLSFCPVRRAENLDIIEDAFPLVDMPLSVKLESAPAHVKLVPDGADLAFEYRDGYAHTRVTATGGHVMVVFE